VAKETISRGALIHAKSVSFALGKLSNVERPVRARTSANTVQIATIKLTLKHITRGIDLLAKAVWLSFEKVALDSIRKGQIRSREIRSREIKRERASRERYKPFVIAAFERALSFAMTKIVAVKTLIHVATAVSHDAIAMTFIGNKFANIDLP